MSAWTLTLAKIFPSQTALARGKPVKSRIFGVFARQAAGLPVRQLANAREMSVNAGSWSASNRRVFMGAAVNS
jgi:hypothetical protein